MSSRHSLLSTPHALSPRPLICWPPDIASLRAARNHARRRIGAMKGAQIITFPVSRARPDALLRLVDDVLKARETTSEELKPKQPRLLEVRPRFPTCDT